MQLYACHCFVPAVQAIAALEDEDNKKKGSAFGKEDATTAGQSVLSTPSKTRKSKGILEGLEDKLLWTWRWGSTTARSSAASPT